MTGFNIIKFYSNGLSVGRLQVESLNEGLNLHPDAWEVLLKWIRELEGVGGAIFVVDGGGANLYVWPGGGNEVDFQTFPLTFLRWLHIEG